MTLRAAVGERLSGFTYGTIVVLSVIVAEAQADAHAPGRIAVVALATTVVFWLAHVYAHALGHSVAHDEPLAFGEVRAIAFRERSIVEAALGPIAALVAGAVGLVSDGVAVWAAFAVGLLVLGVEGLYFARIEHLRPAGAFVVVAANLGLGLALVALKLALGH